MNKVSEDLRNKAASHLRRSRAEMAPAAKAHQTQMAASYKNLADDEEWARGERRRSKKRAPKSTYQPAEK
jgi:hypothetical protein